MHKIKFDNSDYYYRLPFDGQFYTKLNKMLSNSELTNKGIYDNLLAKVNKELASKNKIKDIPEAISQYILISNITPKFDVCKSLLSKLKTNYTHLSISQIIDRIIELKLATYNYNNIKVKTTKRLQPLQQYLETKNNDQYSLKVPKCHSYKLINQLIKLDNNLTYEIE